MSREWENVSKGMEMVLSGAMFPLIRNAGHKRSESQTSQKVIIHHQNDSHLQSSNYMPGAGWELSNPVRREGLRG